jgi:hypothetical protein
MAKTKRAIGDNLGIRPGEQEVLANITHYIVRDFRGVELSLGTKEEAVAECRRLRATGQRVAVYAVGLMPSRGAGVTGVAGPLSC